MQRRALVIIFCLSAVVLGQAQSRFWVELKYKGTEFNPYEYFDKKAIERRLIHGISLSDSSDFPVNSTYLNTISELAEVIYASRWLNAAYVVTTEENAEKLMKYDFVKNILKSENVLYVATIGQGKEEAPDEEKLQHLAQRQINLMKGKLFSQNGITGKGIRIAVFDGGFPEVDRHPAFEHVHRYGRIIATFDFTKNKEISYRGSSHGLSTLSNIGGMYGNILLGLAPDAEYLLAVTEINREILKEEVWWVAAAEWADKNGAQIINSSLGYTEPRYSPAQMDGQFTMVSRAANIAAAKGILVVNAAGNEGSTPSWQIIGAPADADSVLSVGGVNPRTGLKINFSSFGPNARRKLKPNVVASGTTVAARPFGRYGKVEGTSFASPLVAGFAACVMQLRSGLKAMEYFDLIQKSAHLYPYFDYAHGYGAPQADYFFEEKKITDTTFTAQLNVSFNPAQNAPMKNLYHTSDTSLLERYISIELSSNHKAESEFEAFDYFYFHFADEKNELLHYEVVIPDSSFSIPLPRKEVKFFRAFYKGFFKEIILD